MEKETEKMEKEELLIKTLMELEDLAEKKTKIYSRLLTDATLAKDMETFAARHEKRKETLEKLLYGEAQKSKKQKGRYETNEEESGK